MVERLLADALDAVRSDHDARLCNHLHDDDVFICMTMMFFMMRGGMMRRHRGGHAIDLLRERYARGEINQAEYEERRRLLET